MDIDFSVLASRLFEKFNDPYNKFIGHDKQREFLFSNKRVIAMVGANRSGKSEVNAFLAASVARREHPLIRLPDGGGIIWLVALTEKMLKNISWAKLRRYLPDSMIAEKIERPGIYWIRMKNGAQVFGMYCKAGADKFQGEACDLIAFDEEPPEDVYKECLARLVDRDGVMTFSMTPIKGSVWFYRQVYKSKSRDVHVIKVGMRDNPYMKEKRIERLEARYREKGASDDEIQVRVNGEYILWGGRAVFDARCVESILSEREKVPVMQGVFCEDGGWVAMMGGVIRVWEHPNPEHSYVIGADAAQGIHNSDVDAGGDYSAAYVYCMNTKRQVAEIHGHIVPDLFAMNLNFLGLWFTTALIAVEAEKNGVAVLKELAYLHYPSIYMQRPRGKRYDPQIDLMGWMPDHKNKSEGVKNMNRALREDTHGIVSHKLVDEIITYVYNAGGRMGAEIGAHDDLVASCYIALSVAREWWIKSPPAKRYPPGTAGYDLERAIHGK